MEDGSVSRLPPRANGARCCGMLLADGAEHTSDWPTRRTRKLGHLPPKILTVTVGGVPVRAVLPVGPAHSGSQGEAQAKGPKCWWKEPFFGSGGAYPRTFPQGSRGPSLGKRSSQRSSRVKNIGFVDGPSICPCDTRTVTKHHPDASRGGGQLDGKCISGFLLLGLR